ncbi:MAG: hypothetical protein KJO35_05435, partial [Gammaproteobacteria bacterium]|nr:hypothetical protein [Gammaproteobacteria bacterium]
MKLQPLAIASLVFICACGGSSGSNSGGGAAVDASVPSSCSVVEQNTFVNDVMRDIYYWVDEMPDADPAAFESPEELLEFLRFEELDRFSAIADEAEEDAFFSNSQFIGVGIGTLLVGDDQLRITQTFSDGPARAAGLDRGFFITEINGQTIREVLDNGGVSAAFGPDTVGTPVDLRYTDLVGNDVEITIFKDVVTIDTVSASAVFDVAGKQTGYLNFRNFVEPSFAALADVFADLSGQGVQELVLDLRYNGGGLISVANYLSGLLGGQLTAGDIFARRVHNTKNVGRNINTFFQVEPDALDL